MSVEHNPIGEVFEKEATANNEANNTNESLSDVDEHQNSEESDEDDFGRVKSMVIVPEPASPKAPTMLLDAPVSDDEDDRGKTNTKRGDVAPRAKRPRASDLNDADDPPKRCNDGRRRNGGNKFDGWEEKKAEPKKEPDNIMLRSGGAYIPPAKLRLMQAQIEDKSSEAYQRMNWDRLKKRINGQVNRVNISNIVEVVRTLLQENIERGKGLLVRSLIQAQSFSPSFSHVFAALTAIINSKFPLVGHLLLRRLIIQFKRSFRRNDKITCVNVCKFLAHLVNQRVAHEIIVLEILVLLMHAPTDDSIEVAVTLLKECGAILQKVTPKGSNAIFDRLRAVLNEADTIEHRTQYMIETMFHIRKSKFEGYPIVREDLDLVDEEDQITHPLELTTEDGKPYDAELQLNVFRFDLDFEKNEAEYDEIRKEIIGDDDEDDEDEAEAEDATEDANGEIDELAPPTLADGSKIIDMTGQDLVAFRRNVYLTIQSSLDFQEAAHKLLKKELRPGMEAELCHMIVDCCAQLRTYERFYGLLSERFCKLRREFQTAFERIARDTYHAIARFDITKLRNMAKLIAHLLATDAIDWDVLSEIRLNETDTTSAGRIYIKYVFEELVQTMSEVKVYERTCDPTLQHAFEGILPRDNPKDTIFAINFFTLSGLGNLTIDLREHLQKVQKKRVKKEQLEEEEENSSSSTSSLSSSSSSSSSSSDSESDSSSSTSSSESSVDSVKSKKNANLVPISKRKGLSSPKREKAYHEKSSRQTDILKIKDEPVDPEYDRSAFVVSHRDGVVSERQNYREHRRKRSPLRRDKSPKKDTKDSESHSRRTKNDKQDLRREHDRDRRDSPLQRRRSRDRDNGRHRKDDSPHRNRSTKRRTRSKSRH